MGYILAFLIIFTGYANAEVWVTHKDGVIYSLSEANDAVVPNGYSVDILKGSIEDLGLNRPMNEYKFVGKKFKVNADAVKAKEDLAIAEDRKKEEKKNKKKSAKDKLKALGLDESEIDALIEEK